MPLYKGKTVTVVRAAISGDRGFNGSEDPALAQVFIKDEDGNASTVLHSEVTADPQPKLAEEKSEQKPPKSQQAHERPRQTHR